MNRHKEKWISGLVDGELTGLRRWRVRRHVGHCAFCATEYRKQLHVREQMATARPAVQMSDSAEFFWSKVKREIERKGRSQVREPLGRLGLTDWFGLHWPALSAATALVLLAFGLAWMSRAGRQGSPAQLAEVTRVQTALPDATATAFQAPEAGVTVIWTTGLPWTADMTQMKTEFANLDT